MKSLSAGFFQQATTLKVAENVRNYRYKKNVL